MKKSKETYLSWNIVVGFIQQSSYFGLDANVVFAKLWVMSTVNIDIIKCKQLNQELCYLFLKLRKPTSLIRLLLLSQVIWKTKFVQRNNKILCFGGFEKINLHSSSMLA